MASKQNPQRGAAKTLPPKEFTQFKSILKFYEDKQYKKGLKAAEAILKKFPDHGETLALKGLVLNSMNKKTEAYELVKRGLKNDLQSYICWHVLGLLYRSDRDYAEAIKCYRNALRHDKENSQILRDLSLLQIQTRDLKGFLETRRQLLLQKPTTAANWIQFAISHQLSGNCATAIKVLESYEKTRQNEDKEKDKEKLDFEQAELMLYKAEVLEEGGEYEAALNHLNTYEPKILDKMSVKERKASVFLKMSRFEEAQKEFLDLLDSNSENYRYHTGLQRAHNLNPSDPANQDKLEAVYADLAAKFPSSHAIKRVPLDFLYGKKFSEALDKYLRPHLRKGTPSLFNLVKPLYGTPEKVSIIEEVVSQYVDSLKSTGKFPGDNSGAPEPATTLLWTLYFFAQHFDRRKNFKKAFELIDAAIEHTPTVIDLYLTKGRFYKHAGDVKEAATLFDTGRQLDLADRYLNTKCARYFLKADLTDEAEKIMSLFAKDTENTISNLFEMQCMWYELQSGESFFRLEKYGLSLKNFYAIEKHYTDIYEDQFDFHTYALRKGTLRTYLDLLRFEDNLKSQKRYVAAVQGIIKCYIKIHDKPNLLNANSQKDDALANMDPSERKKLERKEKKRLAKESAQKEVEKQAKAKAAAATTPSKKTEEDAEGEKYLKETDPLGVATKYYRLIEVRTQKNLEANLLAIELFLRKNKPLLTLKVIKRAAELDQDNAQLHLNIVKFFNDVQKRSGEIHTTVLSVVKPEMEKILKGKSLEDYNKSILAHPTHKNSLQHRLAAAEGGLVLNPSKKDEVLAWLKEENLVSPLEDCIRVAEFVKQNYDEKTFADFKAKFHALHPYASAFKPPSAEQPKLTTSDN